MAKSSKKDGRSKPAATKSTKASSNGNPKFIVCPYSEQKVFIARATLSDLKNKSTFSSKQKRLWTIPSASTRHEIYCKAAVAIAEWEQSLMPSYGRRTWDVTVSISEPSANVLFRTWKNDMELAVLPHLLERIPRPPRWPGQLSRQNEQWEENYQNAQGADRGVYLLGREVSDLSKCAWEELRPHYAMPTFTVKWRAPNFRSFTSRKSAWEYATELCEKELQISKFLLGIGSSGKLLRPNIPSVPASLKVGVLRFERDGLWVVGQELSWQDQREQELFDLEEERRVAVEEALRTRAPDELEPEHKRLIASPRRKHTGISIYLATYKLREQATATQGKMSLREAEEILRKKWKKLTHEEKIEWRLRAVELNGDPIEASAAPKEPAPIPEKAKKWTPIRFFMESRRYDYRDARMLDAPGGKRGFTMADADAELRQIWKVADPLERETWKLKMEAAIKELQDAETQEKSTLRDRKGRIVVAGCGVEELEEMQTSVAEAEFLEATRQRTAGFVRVPQTADDTTKEKPNPDSCECEEKKITDNSREETDTKSNCDLAEASAGSVDDQQHATASIVDSSISEDPPSFPDEEELSVKEYASKVEDLLDLSQVSHSSKNETSVSDSLTKSPHHSLADAGNNGSITIVSATDEEADGGDMVTDSSQTVVASMAVVAGRKKKKPSSNKKRSIPLVHRQRWCLNADQIKFCHDAIMDHYECVMRTVKSRDLIAELQDGFDVLRERGRGRFDMEVPAFESEMFSFLNCVQTAPWMPIVKAILGDDAVLIHKGSFMSLPGAETQEYHQDGVHLTKQAQKPCHAVNVFIPLVDLTSRNGPTEFVLGSHILGQDDFDRDFVEIPTVKAGIPIMFDYRLGHRGLGNSSQSCRPIVYCTYARAAQGKEFRDSVNFSRKRYHTIGELVGVPLSREERRKKRKTSIQKKEEAELEKALAISTCNETAEGITKSDAAVTISTTAGSMQNAV